MNILRLLHIGVACICALAMLPNAHALAPAGGDYNDMLLHMRLRDQFDAVATTLDAMQFPRPAAQTEIQEKLRALHKNEGIRTVFFPGFPGFIAYVPAAGDTLAQMMVYRLRDATGAYKSPSTIASIFFDAFFRSKPQVYRPHARFDRRVFNLRSENAEAFQRILDTEDIIQRPLEFLQENGRLRVAPIRWTPQKLENFLRMGNWQGINVIVRKEDQRAQLENLGSRSEEVLAGQVRSRAIATVQASLNAQSLMPALVVEQKTRAAQVIGALGLRELQETLRALVDANSRTDPTSDYLTAWADLQQDYSPDVLEYLLGKARHRDYTAVALGALAKSNSVAAARVITGWMQDAQHPVKGQDMLYYWDAFFAPDQWPGERNRLEKATASLAPDLFAAINLRYGSWNQEARNRAYEVGKRVLALLPESYPAPEFFLEHILEQGHAKLELLLGTIPDRRRVSARQDFLNKIRFLPWHRMIWAAGTGRRRDALVSFWDRRGIVLEKAGNVSAVLLPTGLSADELREALLATWIEYLRVSGLLDKATPEFREAATRHSFMGRMPGPVTTRLFQKLQRGWMPKTWDAVHQAIRFTDIIPALTEEIRSLPERNRGMARWYGERFFQGLHGVFGFYMINEIVNPYPAHNQLMWVLGRLYVQFLLGGLTPADAFEEVFRTPYAEKEIFEQNIPVNPAARDLTLEREAVMRASL